MIKKIANDNKTSDQLLNYYIANKLPGWLFCLLIHEFLL